MTYPLWPERAIRLAIPCQTSPLAIKGGTAHIAIAIRVSMHYGCSLATDASTFR